MANDNFLLIFKIKLISYSSKNILVFFGLLDFPCNSYATFHLFFHCFCNFFLLGKKLHLLFSMVLWAVASLFPIVISWCAFTLAVMWYTESGYLFAFFDCRCSLYIHRVIYNLCGKGDKIGRARPENREQTCQHWKYEPIFYYVSCMELYLYLRTIADLFYS